MEPHIEIVGDKVTCRQGSDKTASVALADFLRHLREGSDTRLSFEPIPDTVRFGWQRGDASVMVMEQKPAVHTVRWLADNSRVPFGRGAVYREARLAFPFVVVAVAFEGGCLTGLQQCFYRRAPLAGLQDELLLPNLLNVARGYDQICWLCLANLNPDMSGVSWNERVRKVWSHLFEAGFNASSEQFEGNSYWQTMRSVDARVATVDEWERQSASDPFFPLAVEWRGSGKTVGGVMDEMMNRVSPVRTHGTAADLLAYFYGRAGRRVRRGLWWK